MAFTLHPKLAEDCIHIADLTVCRVMLMNSAYFPWLVLVPMREGMRELHDLSEADHAIVMEEIRGITVAFNRLTGAHKMNMAALGNVVPQLHIHIIARFEGDAAWPNPVWNAALAPMHYTAEQLDERLHGLRQMLAAL